MSAASYSLASSAVDSAPTTSLFGGRPPALRNNSCVRGAHEAQPRVAPHLPERLEQVRHPFPLRASPTNSTRAPSGLSCRSTGRVIGMTPHGTRYSFEGGMPRRKRNPRPTETARRWRRPRAYSSIMRSRRRGATGARPRHSCAAPPRAGRVESRRAPNRPSARRGCRVDARARISTAPCCSRRSRDRFRRACATQRRQTRGSPRAGSRLDADGPKRCTP